MLRISTFLEAIESLFMVLLDDIIVTGFFELNFHEDWIEARIVVDHVLLLPPPLCLNCLPALVLAESANKLTQPDIHPSENFPSLLVTKPRRGKLAGAPGCLQLVAAGCLQIVAAGCRRLLSSFRGGGYFKVSLC